MLAVLPFIGAQVAAQPYPSKAVRVIIPFPPADGVDIIGGIPHLTGELFRLRAKIDIVHVPYKGTPAAVTDLTAGQIALIFANTLSVAPYINAGRLRALAIGSTADEFRDRIGADLVKWTATIKAAGVRAE